MTADNTYQPKVYRSANGDEQHIASGGLLQIESGGSGKVASGGIFLVEDGGLFRIGTSYTLLGQYWDGIDTMTAKGPVRHVGFNTLSRRYELKWVAGQRGKPAINADINSATEATREVADPDFEILGVNGTSALCTYNAEGGITLTTAGADGDEMILLGHLDTNQSAWGTVTWGLDQEVVWEAHIKSGANITNAIIWAGLKLTNTEVKATDNDQVYFRYEDDVTSGKWEVVWSIAGVDVSTDSGLTVVLSTDYHLKIVVDSSRIARCYINGALVCTTTALADATDLKPYIGVAADGAAAAKALHVRGQAISRNFA
jgi:hypothetical protein